MARTFRKFMVPAAAGLLALTMMTARASADELLGKVKSVDVVGKKIVVTEKSTAKDAELAIGSATTWTKEKKGKVAKKFELAKLKVGTTVEVTRDGSNVSNVRIKDVKKKAAQ